MHPEESEAEKKNSKIETHFLMNSGVSGQVAWWGCEKGGKTLGARLFQGSKGKKIICHGKKEGKTRGARKEKF